MTRQSVQSSHIKSIGHDAGANVLEIEFANGSIYQYRDVPARVYQALLAAPSVGRYFHRGVNRIFKGTLTEPKRAQHESPAAASDAGYPQRR